MATEESSARRLIARQLRYERDRRAELCSVAGREAGRPLLHPALADPKGKRAFRRDCRSGDPSFVNPEVCLAH